MAAKEADHEGEGASEEGNWENALKKLGFNFGVLNFVVLSVKGNYVSCKF